MWRTDSLLRWLAASLLVLLTPLAAMAEDDPPGRVGRLSEIKGSVSYYDADQGQWTAASRNRPLTGGDRLSTDGDARAELRIGSSTLRLGEGTEIELVQLDDDKVIVQLHSGQLAVRIRDREVADETEIVTAEARLRPLRSGHFRVDRIDDTTYAGSWRGELRVDGGGDTFTVDNGRRAEIWREGGRGGVRHSWASLPDDGFGQWVLNDEKRDERSASSRYVSPEMTGAEDLDRNGRWEQHPEFGAVWLPLVVQAGWAPYRYGHWAWIRPWGWTWVDDAPWGFAPFHYGRWVSWGGRWGWSPGTYVRRPVFAPALVAWVGGPNIGVSINIGGPSVGWVPLAPREVYVPWYRYSPAYGERVNHRPPGSGWRAPVPGRPIMYGNQGVPNAVTVVPKDVLVRREPVARAVIDLRGAPQQRAPAVPMAAPAGPGGAVPAPVRRVTSDEGRPAPPRRVIQPVAPGLQQPQRDNSRESPRENAREQQREQRENTRDNNQRDDNRRDDNRRDDNPRDGRREIQPVRPLTPPAAVDPRQQPQQPTPQQPTAQPQRPAVQAAPPQAAPAPAPARENARDNNQRDDNRRDDNPRDGRREIQPVRPVTPPAAVEQRQQPQQPAPQQPTPQPQRPAVQAAPQQAAPAPAPAARPRPPERVETPARETAREAARENAKEREDRGNNRGNQREREQNR